MAILDRVMADDPEPPRKFYGFKPKEFERVNAPPPSSAADATAHPAPDPGPGSLVDPAQRIDVRDLARQAAGGTPLLGGTNAPANRANDVHALLRDNLDRANAAGINEVSLRPKRRSRRWRDYWLLLLPVNAIFLFWAFGPYSNPATFVYGIGGIGLYTAALTWVMFGVMSDY